MYITPTLENIPEHVVMDDSLERCLEIIQKPEINLVIYPRHQNDDLAEALKNMDMKPVLEHIRTNQRGSRIEPFNASECALPEIFTENIALIADTFYRILGNGYPPSLWLSDATEIDFDYGRTFHSDSVSFRMHCRYGGGGLLWTPNDNTFVGNDLYIKLKDLGLIFQNNIPWVSIMKGDHLTKTPIIHSRPLTKEEGFFVTVDQNTK